MGDPRSDAIDGVVAELVTGQVHHHPELPSADQRPAEAIPVPRTFGHRDVDAPLTRSLPESPRPHLSHHTSFCRGAKGGESTQS